MKKRILSIRCMMPYLLLVTMFAADGGVKASQPVDVPVTTNIELMAKGTNGITGKGTEQEPYRIFAAEGLKKFRDLGTFWRKQQYAYVDCFTACKWWCCHWHEDCK